MKTRAPLSMNHAAALRAVGLRYISDATPGIRRERAGQGFRFRDATGQWVKDEETLRRIKHLAIPPAWEDVWICPHPHGHLQATGRDVRRRKQFLYHERWREIRDETKYNRLVEFAKALGNIRKRVRADVSKPGLGREKVLGTIVRLLDLTAIRIGNEEYARDNKSFGLTTLQDRHAKVRSGTIRFCFRGKHGVEHQIELEHPRLARIVKKCQDLPGQDLFQYIESNGGRRDVQSGDVNDYLRDISGMELTAKDFRTWAGTVLAARALQTLGSAESKKAAKKHITTAIKTICRSLGNTPAICRKCYVHPEIINGYSEGSLLADLEKLSRKNHPGHGLKPEEDTVLRYLEARMKAGKRNTLEQQLRRSLKAETKSRRIMPPQAKAA